MMKRSIVEYFGSQGESKCGYCKSDSHDKASHGMWTHSLTVDDYQALLDRGWRRAGKYCYKPTLSRTCCPQYTIRCEAANFKMSKSQKRVLKRFDKYLSDDQKHVAKGLNANFAQGNNETEISDAKPKKIEIPPVEVDSQVKLIEIESVKELTPEPKMKSQTVSESPKSGLDPSKPKCTKAKVRRRQKKIDKLISQGLPGVLQKRDSVQRNIEEFMFPVKNESHEEKHKLIVRLVRSSPESAEFSSSFTESFALYKKYQITVHHDPSDQVSEGSFRRFLCDSPLIPRNSNVPEHPGYGSFHQQYFLDNKLVAVGVLDLLTNCVSSKYFFYDPDYSFLCFGIYSALREVVLVRLLARLEQRPFFYYMGFYIHNCQKMRYKSRYRPSSLLCPEAYTWIDVKRCLPILDKVSYSRFEENKNLVLVDPDGNPEVDRVSILNGGAILPYGMYVRLSNNDAQDREEVKEYANLVGKKCAYSMCLYRD